MKKTEEKKSKGVKKNVLKLLIKIVVLITAAVGGAAVYRISVNVRLNKLIDNSKTINITNNTGSIEGIVYELINQLKEKDKELSKKNDEIIKLKEENAGLKVSNSSSEAAVGQDTSSTADNSDNDTKASTDAEVMDLFGDGEARTVYSLDNDEGSFKIAGEDYYSGVTIGNAESGCVYVNLKKKYKHISFDVGRVDECPINDGKLLLIKDEGNPKKYDLDAEKSLMSFELDVTGTDRLKIQIDPDWTTYGIVNVKVE